MPRTRRPLVRHAAVAAIAVSLIAVASQRVLGDEPGREPIQYINPKVPSVELPAYRGERYEAVVPDTLDLAERAALGVHGLTAPLDAQADYEVYWLAQFRHHPPVMWHDHTDSTQAKYQEALPLLRLISGSRQNPHVEKRWMEIVMQMQGPDGVLYYPRRGRPWIVNNVDVEAMGQWPEGDHYCVPGMTGRLLGAVTLYYALTGDRRWRKLGERLVDGFSRKAVHRDSHAYFTKGMFAVDEVSDPKAPLPTPWCRMRTSWVAIGLTQFYNVTGYKPALELAGKFCRFMRLHGDIFLDDGTFINIDMHFHGHTHPLVAMVEYGMAAGDQEMIRFAEKGYHYALANMNTVVGYVPEWIKPGCTSEICGVADMIHLALKLTLAGAGDYWDDADRWTRNQFAEGQLTSSDWVEKMVKDLRHPAPPFSTTENVAARCVGGFGGWPTPNDWQGGCSIMGCCVGNGTRAIYYVWENILHYKDGNLKVNLLLNRASPWADLDSSIPYQGRVDVKVKKACDLSVRIPEWVNPNEAKCQVNATDRRLSWNGRYAVVGGVRPKDVVALTFPIFERTDVIRINDQDYTIIRKGNDVVHIDPPGKHCPLYQREKYRGDKVLTTKVERFVAEQQIAW